MHVCSSIMQKATMVMNERVVTCQTLASLRFGVSYWSDILACVGNEGVACRHAYTKDDASVAPWLPWEPVVCACETGQMGPQRAGQGLQLPIDARVCSCLELLLR